MYSIYADQTCIYSDVSPSNKNKILDPVLTLEDNCAGSLEFTIPQINAGYEELKRLTTEIVVKREGTEIWSGRILTEGSDFYNSKKIYCEGELAYLNDSIQPPAEYHDITPRALLETFVNIHNSQVGEKYRFTVGAVTVTDPNNSLYRYTNYESTLQCLSDKFLERLGGHLRVRKQNGVRYLDYLADYPKTATQQINFGKNILDFAKNYNMDDFCTVIVPRGEQIQASDYADNRAYEVGEYCIYQNYIYRCTTAIGEDGEAWTTGHWKKIQKYIAALTPYLTVEEVNNGSIYVENSDLVSRYGRIVNVVDWSDVTDASILLSKARTKLTTINYDKLVIDVTAVDLRLMNVKYEAFDILDNVRIISKPHGIDRLFPIRKMQIPMSQPERTSYTLTYESETDKSLTGSTVKSIQKVADSVDGLSDSMTSMPSKILEDAKANATSLINMATNGYVTLVKNRNGTSELLITDEKDYTRAQKVWRWNVNGLGYSSNGYNGTYGLAMTMNGAIVADYITAGTMIADRIRGGELLVGGSGIAANGSITVKDSSNNTIVTLDKNGITVKKGTIQGPTITAGGNGNSNGTIIVKDSSGSAVVTLNNSGLTVTKGTISGPTISGSNITGSSISGGSITGTSISGGSITGISISGGSITGTDIYGARIYTSIKVQSDTFTIDENGNIYGHGEIYMERGTSSFRYCEGREGISGASLYIWGDKSRIVKTEHHGWRSFTAYETPTGYFGDIGEGKTDNEGVCLINIDEIFLESTDSFCKYQVFLQSYSDATVYVEKREKTYFVVKSSKPNISFGWEIKMPQKDMSGERYYIPPYEVVDGVEKGKNYD